MFSVLLCSHGTIQREIQRDHSVVWEVTSVCIFSLKTEKKLFMSHGGKNNFLISKAGNDHRHQPWHSSTPKHLSPDVDGWRWSWRPLRWIVWLWNHNVVKYNQDCTPTPPPHTHKCTDVMLVSELPAGVFSLAVIYDDLTEVTAQDVLLMLTVAAAGDREPWRGGRFSL